MRSDRAIMYAVLSSCRETYSIWLMLLLLLGIDLFFIGMQTVKMASQYSNKINIDVGIFASPVFNIGFDWSIPEIIGYLKLLTSAIVFVIVYSWTLQFVYLAASCLFSLLMLDDSIQIHERVGSFGTLMSFPVIPGMGADDTGEILVYLVWLLLMTWLVLMTIRKTGRPHLFAMIPTAAATALLAICGVVFDVMGVLLQNVSIRFGRMFVLLEDGGEMIAMTAIVVTATAIYQFFRQIS